MLDHLPVLSALSDGQRRALRLEIASRLLAGAYADANAGAYGFRDAVSDADSLIRVNDGYEAPDAPPAPVCADAALRDAVLKLAVAVCRESGGRVPPESVRLRLGHLMGLVGVSAREVDEEAEW